MLPCYAASALFLFSFLSLLYLGFISSLSLLEKVLERGEEENKSGEGKEGGVGMDGGSNALIQMLPEDLRIPWKEIWGKKIGGGRGVEVRKWRQPGRNCFPVLGRNLRIWSPACFNEDTGNCHRGVKPQVVLSSFFIWVYHIYCLMRNNWSAYLRQQDLDKKGK